MQATKRLMALLVFLTLALAGCTNMPDESVGNNSGSPSDGGGDAGASGTSGEPLELTEGFEEGVDAWTRGSDLPSGASDDAWSANVTADAAHGGEQALALNTGQAGQGTIWLTRTIEGLTAGAGYGVHMSVWTQPGGDVPQEALNDLVLYVGRDAPTGDASFTPENAGSQHMAVRAPLATSGEWQEYTLDWGTPAPENGAMVVAIGISSSADAAITYLLDDLHLAFEPKQG